MDKNSMDLESSLCSKQRRGNSHDALFTCALSDREVAQDFLAQHLPANLYCALDLSTLEICKDKFIDDRLKAKITDMLYRIQLHAGKAIYILVEHQSTVLEEMPLRILHYQGAIMQRHWNRYRTIPFIYALVYYTGKAPWHFPCNLTQQIEAPPAFIKRYAVRSKFKRLDINRIADHCLRKHPYSGIVGMVMKHISSVHSIGAGVVG